MNMIELSKYLLDDEAAEEYLRTMGILKTFTECPFCGAGSVGKMRRSTMKCYKCKKEWHRRRGSFLESRHITNSKFIGFLKLYSDELGIITICDELEIERKHGLTLFNDIREILFGDILHYNDNIERAIIWDDNEKRIQIKFVESEYVPPDVKGFLELNLSRYKEFGGLYSFLVESLWKGNKIRYNNLVNNFVSYLKMKTISYRGIHKKYFFEYLVEQIIRFNYRSRDFFDVLLENLQFSKVVETPLSRKNIKID